MKFFFIITLIVAYVVHTVCSPYPVPGEYDEEYYKQVRFASLIVIILSVIGIVFS